MRIFFIQGIDKRIVAELSNTDHAYTRWNRKPLLNLFVIRYKYLQYHIRIELSYRTEQRKRLWKIICGDYSTKCVHVIRLKNRLFFRFLSRDVKGPFCPE